MSGAPVPGRTRGGNSSWAPPRRGRLTGLRGCTPRRACGMASMSSTTVNPSPIVDRRARGDAAGERAVAAADQERRPHAGAPVAVDRDHGVDVVDEGPERGGRRGVEQRRRHVPVQVVGLADGVERRPRPVGRRGGHDVGALLEAAAVDGQEPEPAAHRAHLFHPGVPEQIGEHGRRSCHEPHPTTPGTSVQQDDRPARGQMFSRCSRGAHPTCTGPKRQDGNSGVVTRTEGPTGETPP